MNVISHTLVVLMTASIGAIAGCAKQDARTSSTPLTIDHEQLADVPGIGVAAAYAGASNGVLLVGGGTNFPNGMPWTGGKKEWTDQVLAMAPGGAWREVGRLPRPVAGGVSVTTTRGVLCAGGGNATEVFADAFLLRLEAGQLVREPLPDLPAPLMGSAVVAIGDRVFIVGGHSKPNAEDPSNAVLSIDLASPQRRWTPCRPLPGPGRHLAVAATDGQSIYAFSGMCREPDNTGGVRTGFLRDAYRYTPTNDQWTRLADVPRSIAAGPSPAPVIHGCAVFLGGGLEASDIVAPMDKREKLNADIVAYELSSGAWRVVGRAPVSVVVAPTIPLNGATVIASGEILAGIRTLQVWSYTPRRTR
jgi:N-acetylneuraminic acid mutarotase